MVHGCSTCKAKREVITKIHDDDKKVYDIIINGVNTAKMAFNQQIVPNDLPKDDIKKYYEKIFNDNIYYQNLLNEWWIFITNKYNIKLTKYLKVDAINNELFQCINSNGNKIIEYIPA